jgi:hypothetical protein
MAIIDVSGDRNEQLRLMLANSESRRNERAVEIAGFREAVYNVYNDVLKSTGSVAKALQAANIIKDSYKTEWQEAVNLPRNTEDFLTQAERNAEMVDKGIGDFYTKTEEFSKRPPDPTAMNMSQGVGQEVKEMANPFAPKMPMAYAPKLFADQGQELGDANEAQVMAAITQGNQAGIEANRRYTGAELTADQSADNTLAEKDFQSKDSERKSREELNRTRQVGIMESLNVMKAKTANLNANTRRALALAEKAEAENKKGDPNTPEAELERKKAAARALANSYKDSLAKKEAELAAKKNELTNDTALVNAVPPKVGLLSGGEQRKANANLGVGKSISSARIAMTTARINVLEADIIKLRTELGGLAGLYEEEPQEQKAAPAAGAEAVGAETVEDLDINAELKALFEQLDAPEE